MGKASTGKKVARAASTGGGRTARGRRPWGWYSVIAGVSILGMFLIVISRQDLKAAKVTDHPKVGEHWHVAYGFNVCGAFLPSIALDRDPLGIHTHNKDGIGDGIVHVHPFTSKAAGVHATLGVFAETTGTKLSSTQFKLPGEKKAHKTGDKCGPKPAFLRVSVNGKEYTGDPRKLRFLKDRSWVVVAILPRDVKIPQPPSVPALDSLSDVGGSRPTVPPVSIEPHPEGSSPPASTPGSSPPASTPPKSTATSSP